jgi:NTP pyrophosphatase (non-canonical NTP hydrolase)
MTSTQNMGVRTAGICLEIAKERIKQDIKWGQQDHLTGRWFEILGEETGEACRAVLEQDPDKYRKEMIQVAAVAIAAIETLDRLREKGEGWRS